MTFEEIVTKKVEEVRSKLDAMTEATEFNFQVKATGRVSTGEVLIEFSVGDSSWGDSRDPASNNVDAAVDELIHRVGWSKRNAPLRLSRYGDKDKTDIPH